MGPSDVTAIAPLLLQKKGNLRCSVTLRSEKISSGVEFARNPLTLLASCVLLVFMRQMDNKNVQYFFLGIVFSCLAFPLSIKAETLSMDYSLGFSGHFQLKQWTPLFVTLENTGKPLTGTVEVIVTSGSEYLHNISQVTHVMKVELPSHSKKLCAFTIYLDTFIHDLRIQFRRTETILLSRSVNLRPSFTEKHFAVVVNDHASPDFLDGFPSRLFAVHVRPKYLPETWYGYESVRVMILDAGLLKGLRERQFEALLQWIEQGGNVVVTGGINIGAFQEPRTRRLLPIQIAGHRQFLELQTFRDFCGRVLTSSSPFLVLQSRIENADVLLREDEVPLIFHTSFGTGHLFFLAFDVYTPPFSRWPVRTAFWETLLSRRQAKPELHLDLQYILHVLLSTLSGGFQNKKLMVTLLMGYLTLLFLIVRRLGKSDSHRLRNVVFWALLAVLFSLTSYRLFFYSRNKQNLTYNSFLHLHLPKDHSLAFGTSLLGLYTIQETPYHICFDSAAYPIKPVQLDIRFRQSSRTVPMPYLLHEDPGEKQISGVAGAWSYYFFQFHSSLKFPLRGHALVDERGLSLEVDNRTLYPIRDCQIYFQNAVFAIGDIVPGEKQKKLIPQAELTEAATAEKDDEKLYFSEHNTPATETLSLQERVIAGVEKIFGIGIQKPDAFFTAVQRQLFEPVVKTIQASYQTRSDTACLIGWIPERLIPMNVPEAQRHGEAITLVTWDISVNRTK